MPKYPVQQWRKRRKSYHDPPPLPPPPNTQLVQTLLSAALSIGGKSNLRCHLLNPPFPLYQLTEKRGFDNSSVIITGDPITEGDKEEGYRRRSTSKNSHNSKADGPQKKRQLLAFPFLSIYCFIFLRGQICEMDRCGGFKGWKFVGSRLQLLLIPSYRPSISASAAAESASSSSSSGHIIGIVGRWIGPTNKPVSNREKGGKWTLVISLGWAD